MLQRIEPLSTTPADEVYDLDLRQRINALIEAMNELIDRGNRSDHRPIEVGL